MRGTTWFRLGGNSLLATRVLARLRARFGVSCRCASSSSTPPVRQPRAVRGRRA
ncbi:acyl carrier protein, partial [Corallococcus sp. 4LFB]|uniref:acyl carrier protein n=1 Tax=Corallococcus sp. 4LFB TaxID=3383249 RepID=UPI003974E351